MMTQFCCLPAQVIQAPCLLSSAQGPASLCCCSWTHKHRHCAWSSCVVYVGQRWSGQLSAALDCTRLNRKEVGYVRASHAQSKLLAAKKGCHYTLGNATFCKRLRPRHRVIRLDCAPADDINDLVLADANAADNSISDLASTEEEDTGSFGAPGSASTVYIGKDSNNLPKEGQRVRECPIERLQELLLVAQQELENARANSAKLEETAQRIAEEAFVVRDQAVEAKNAAKLANQEFENILGQEARVEDTLEKARVALTTAGVKVMLAEDALAEVLEKLNADQSDHAIRLFRNRVAPFPAELTQGLTFGGSLESEIVSGNSNAAGAVNDAEDFAPQVSLIPINSEEFVLSPSVLSDVDMVKAENQNREGTSSVDGYEALAAEKAEELSRAHMELKHAETTLQKLEEDLARMRSMKSEFLKLATHLREVARKANENAAAAHDDAAYAMSLAEQAVAWEVEAAQRVSDAEMKLQKAETHAADALQAASLLASAEMAHKLALQVTKASDAEHEFSGLGAERMQVADEGHGNGLSVNGTQTISERLDSSLLSVMDDSSGGYEDLNMGPNFGISSGAVDSQRKAIREVESESRRLDVGSIKEEDIIDRPRMSENLKRLEVVKEGTSPGIAKAVKRSSRFFSASYFSFAGDGVEYFPNSLFSGLAAAVKRQLPKVLIGVALLAGGWVLNSQLQRQEKLLPSDWTSSTLNVKTDAKPLSFQLSTIPRCMKKLIDRLPPQEVNDEETSLFDVIWLLLASVVFVPIFQKMPGAALLWLSLPDPISSFTWLHMLFSGSPVLGYLAAGVLIGPYTLSIIKHVHGTKAIAEFGVVFLLFNIGLELSVERLSSMKKYVFGFGSSQVLCTALCIGLFAHQLASISVPAAIIVGNGLALSSTAVVLQVLQERGESTSRHGRATFSVLLFQDLAVVVLLILIPLLSPNSSKGGVGLQAIAEALGIAAIKAVMAISGIIAGGRLLLRPAYKRMAENHNPEIFAANTLLIVLGTSLLTARAGLSMALGAFLAGLLLAETEYALQVESDIAPYRGLLLGLFFMTVGMSIDPNLFLAKFPVILGALALLVSGKTLLVACVGRQFGLSTVAAVRAGLLLSPGGEFAFVAFGEAVNQGIMTTQLSSLLFLVVGLSMALTPWLAAGGQLIAARFEQQDVRSLLPVENETDDLQDHIIICGFGRVGQIIGQLLAERLIPFVALDVRSERVNMGRGLDLPVYFGDAGSREVLHKVGAGRAAAAVITLDTPGANYRTVWAISKHFPHLKTFVRAHDVDHGISLEKAGATAVVPETLEPSLQLAAAVLAQAKLPASEIAATIDDFRSRHLSELSELSEASGTSLGYGFSRIIAKAKSSSVEVVSKGRLKNDDDGQTERTDGGIVSIGA